MNFARIFLIHVFIVFPVLIKGQDPDSLHDIRKELIMSSNNITSIMYSYGSIGKPNTLGNIGDFMWNGLGYMYEFGPIIAAEVESKNGDTLQICSDSFVLPGQGDYSPEGEQKWGWLPSKGYSNPNSNSIANFLDPSSWPVNWENWFGKNGTDTSLANNEAFFVMDDFSNAEFNYFPFGSEDNRRGLGIKSEVRIYQFGSQFEDAILYEYTFTNESHKNLNEVYFGFWGDPHIGGPSNWSDDRVGAFTNEYNQYLNETIYLWDEDMTGDGGRRSGFLGFKLLETPDDMGLTALHADQFTSSDPNVPRNDPLVWQWFTEGINTENSPFREAGDNIVFFGTGPFNLEVGKSKAVKLVIFCSHDFEDLKKDAVYFSAHHYWPNMLSKLSTSQGNDDYKISLEGEYDNVNGDKSITWEYLGGDNSAKVYLECSPNLGRDWYYVGETAAIDEQIMWNTEDYNDGVNYILRLISYDPDQPENHYYTISNSRFTIDNPNVNAKPELQMITNLEGEVIMESPLKIEWNSEDADNSSLNVKLEYSRNFDSGFKLIDDREYANGDNYFDWDLTELPNWTNYYLRITATDGNSDTSLVFGSVEINVYDSLLSSSSLEHRSGNSTAYVGVQIADQSALKPDHYKISFDVDGIKKHINVDNITKQTRVLTDFPIIENLSTSMFDGIKLLIKDSEPNINSELTKFNREELASSFHVYFSEFSADYIGNPHIAIDNDWLVIFNDLDTNADGSWMYPADSILSPLTSTEAICPFKIFDVSNPSKPRPANYILEEFPPGNKKWDFSEQILLRRLTPDSETEVSYALKFSFTENALAGLGDTLFIKTYNPIDEEDQYYFTIDSSLISSVDNFSSTPDEFLLAQNYPNPFNPTTTIDYQVPKTAKENSKVKLVIYDILGREVKTLVNKSQRNGRYSVKFNAGNVSSGVYLYRLSVNNKVLSKKMILLR